MSPQASYQQINKVVHAPIRLAILSTLVTVEQADFNYLKQITSASDGNLSTHLKKLEDVEYVEVEKKFVDKKPRSVYRLTEIGRDEFLNYVNNLEQFLVKK